MKMSDSGKERKNTAVSCLTAAFLLIILFVWCCGQAYAGEPAQSSSEAGIKLGRVENLSIAVRSESSLSLSWAENPEADGYLVERYSGGKWKRVAEKGKGETKHTVSELQEGTEYRFRVSSYGENISESGATEIEAYTLPGKVGKLKISKYMQNALQLSWTRNSKASGYLVERYADGKWAPIAEIRNNGTVKYDITGLKACTSYKFRVSSVIYEGEKRLTGVAATVEGRTILAPVSDLKFQNRTTTGLTLSWTKNADASGYYVYQYKSGKWKQMAKLGKNAKVSWRAAKLKENTKYRFRVRCFRKAGKQTYYSSYADLSGKTVLSKPAGVKISGRSSSALKISWKRNRSAACYRIEKYQNGEWVKVADTAKNTVLSRTVGGLKANTTYKLRVRNVTYDGKTKLYSSAAAVSGKTGPSKVTGLKISRRSSDSMTLTWKKNAAAKGYLIEKYKGKKWTRVAKIGKNSTRSYKIKGLKAGTANRFRVRCFRIERKTVLYGSSVKISGKTRPVRPSGVKITARSQKSLRIGWKKNSSAQGYLIQQYRGGKWVEAARINKGTARSCTIKNLKQYTGYKFRVRAFVNEDGKKLYSTAASLSGKVRPKPVQKVKISGTSVTYIKIKWTRDKKAAGYTVERYRKGRWINVAVISGNKKVSCKISGLSQASRYHFRVKAYVKDSGKRITGGAAAVYGKTKARKLSGLKKKLQTKLKKYSGSWSVYVKDLKTGESFSINNRRHYAASVIKTFVMASTYNQIEKGTLKNTAYIRRLLKAMITRSDNESFNELVKRQAGGRNFRRGANVVNAYLRTNGYSGTVLAHTLHPASSPHLSIGSKNQVTASDCGKLLERIYRGKCVSKKSSSKMLKLMLKQQRRSKIPGGLPKGTKVANKTGETGTTDHDIAIVYGPRTTYILCVLSSNSRSGVSGIRSVSSAVYRYLNK